MNQKYYSRYPSDVPVVQRIVSFLAAQPGGGVVLPCGTLLTPRLFQTLGLSGACVCECVCVGGSSWYPT